MGPSNGYVAGLSTYADVPEQPASSGPLSAPVVVDMNVPAGAYIANVSFWASNVSNAQSVAYCVLEANGGNGGVSYLRSAVPPLVNSTADVRQIAATGAFTVSGAGGSITLRCYDGTATSSGTMDLRDVRLTAIQVGTLTVG